jgi:hypothetical protein
MTIVDELVETNVVDHLEVDPPIRGQRYACISFVSPGDAIACKEVFTVHKYLRNLVDDFNNMIVNLETIFEKQATVISMLKSLREGHAFLKNPDEVQIDFRSYLAQSSQEIDDEFKAAHGEFKTNIHGFKIRGVYDTVEDASLRAKTIKKFDDKFDVFVAEVGCWCPWSPNVSEIKEVEYSETQLNTLMKKYNEAQDAKDELYYNRKERLMANIKDETSEMLDRAKAQIESTDAEENRLATKSEETAGPSTSPAASSISG